MSETALPPDLVFLQWLIDECRYRHPKPLGDGRYAAIAPYAYTQAIITGRIGDWCGFDDRWCFASYDKAKAAFDAWDGQGEPVGWHRHPATGRRVATEEGERDPEGRVVPIGEAYVNL